MPGEPRDEADEDQEAVARASFGEIWLQVMSSFLKLASYHAPR